MPDVDPVSAQRDLAPRRPASPGPAPKSTTAGHRSPSRRTRHDNAAARNALPGNGFSKGTSRAAACPTVSTRAAIVAGARPPHRRRRASGSTPPAPPPAAPGSCAGAGTGRFLLPRQLRAAPGTQPAPPGVRSSAHGPCRSPGQDAFGCVLAGIPGAYTNSSTPGRGNTHRRAPATSAQSRCLLPTISNPLPISQRRHGIAVLRQRPSSLLPAPGPASRAARACRSGSTWLREGAPSGGGLALGAPTFRPAGRHPTRSWPEIAVQQVPGCRCAAPSRGRLPYPAGKTTSRSPEGPVGSRILTVISASSSAQSADHRGGPCPGLFRAAR